RVGEGPLWGSELEREGQILATDRDRLALERVEEEHRVQQLAALLEDRVANFARRSRGGNDEGEVAAHRREARDLAIRRDRGPGCSEGGGVELEDGHSSGEAERPGGPRVELAHHAGRPGR